MCCCCGPIELETTITTDSSLHSFYGLLEVDKRELASYSEYEVPTIKIYTVNITKEASREVVANRGILEIASIRNVNLHNIEVNMSLLRKLSSVNNIRGYVFFDNVTLEVSVAQILSFSKFTQLHFGNLAQNEEKQLFIDISSHDQAITRDISFLNISRAFNLCGPYSKLKQLSFIEKRKFKRIDVQSLIKSTFHLNTLTEIKYVTYFGSGTIFEGSLAPDLEQTTLKPLFHVRFPFDEGGEDILNVKGQSGVSICLGVISKIENYQRFIGFLKNRRSYSVQLDYLMSYLIEDNFMSNRLYEFG